MVPTPVIRTPISMKDFVRAMIVTIRVFGDTPAKEACAVLWAQYAIETGAGGYCWNHNLFNHKCPESTAARGVPYMMLANTWEIIDGKKVTFQPPHPATWFRAYASFEAAMSDHITSVKNGRYASSWPAALAGDVREYAAQLRAHGYYTASLESYQAGLQRPFDAFMKSPAYEDVLADIEEASMEETRPSMRPPVIQDFATVTRLPFSDDDDPGPKAA